MDFAKAIKDGVLKLNSVKMVGSSYEDYINYIFWLKEIKGVTVLDHPKLIAYIVRSWRDIKGGGLD
jgi:hypothetical protein